jgi:O-antigen/teichoic acid export membrane protein
MRYLKKLSSLVNVGFRGSTLVFRFLLSFYIIKYLGYDATGIYGLTVGAIGILPAVVGWGLNYFVFREVVGKAPLDAASMVRNRLVVTTVTLAVLTVVALVAALATGHAITTLHLLIVVLIWLETYGLDIHLPLIAQEMATQANLLVFVRSALWVPIVIGLGVFLPTFRTLEVVFAGWIISYAAAVALLAYFLRSWPLREVMKTAVDYDWIKDRLRHSWHIYMSDLSIVGLIFIDRYIVSYMLGLTLTVIYTFFWSLTNALQTLMQTAVTQLALPVLFKAYSDNALSRWKTVFRQQMKKAAVISTIMGVGIFIGTEVLIRLMGMNELGEHRDLFLLMLLAAMIRSFADLLNIGLTSRKKDRHYATINVMGLCLSVLMAFAMMALFGFIGAGIASLITAILITLIRGLYLLHFVKSTPSA